MRHRVVFLLLLGIVALGLFVVVGCRSSSREDVAPVQFAEVAPRLVGEPPAPEIPEELALKQIYTLNQSAFIPPQCYTKTVDEQGKVHNPCYTCHVSSRAPNFINDPDVQLEYAFVPRARKNSWTNLFVDWSPEIASVSDEEILRYVRQSNYFDEHGEIVLASRLRYLPKAWDHKDDGKWEGYVPDARFRFDAEGFDLTRDGGHSGWRALAYYPVPGTFWPTNGSMGDVLIRLPKAFRENEAREPNLTIYKLNLAIVEALVTRRSIAIDRVDERQFGVDLDRDGKLGHASRVEFGDDAPAMSYVGRAKTELAAGNAPIGLGLFPLGTEFLHSVRYLDPGSKSMLGARLKELRYAKKGEWWTVEQLDKRARVEAITKVDSPSELRNYGGNIEIGVNNNQGWNFQGFIEDEGGALRPQSFEESVYCIGCHGGIGATDDGIFSFSRRLGKDAFQQGWYHWSQQGLEGVPDRPIHESATEYVTYLTQNGAGDEFRENAEVAERFFDEQGRLKAEMRARLQRDVTSVLMPSEARALALNKAYRALVKRQSFRVGREIVLGGARNVHRQVDEGQKTGIAAAVAPAWSPKPLTLANSE